MAAANLHELLLVTLIVLAKVGTETTLTIVYVCHSTSPIALLSLLVAPNCGTLTENNCKPRA